MKTIKLILILFCFNHYAMAWPNNQVEKLQEYAYSQSGLRQSSGHYCNYLQLNPKQLEDLFAAGKSDNLPMGNKLGCIVGVEKIPQVLSITISKILSLFWDGKVFNPEGNLLINKFPILKPIKFERSGMAFVYRGKSKIDGAPAIILDYTYTNDFLPGFNGVIQSIRDEIREVYPGRFIGTVLIKINNTYYPTSIYFSLH